MMKTRISLLGLAIIASAQMSFIESPNMRYTYAIEDGSRLIIEGSSNINSFGCLDKSNFPPTPFMMSAIDDTIRFTNAVLLLKTKNLDCDNSKMNKDLCNAMKADEYPYIKVELHKAMIQSGSFQESGEWIYLKAIATLTITSVDKLVTMEVQAKRIASNKYRFKAIKELRMTDFNIQPPSAMLGLIKVKDAIRINFDLTAQAKAN